MRFESLSLLIVDLREVLIHLSPLNDLPAVHVVTGKMQRIVTRALMLGKKLEIGGKVEVSADGSEAEPCYFSSDFHLVYQLWISLLREEIFGRSPEYCSPTFNTTPQNRLLLTVMVPHRDSGKQSFDVN